MSKWKEVKNKIPEYGIEVLGYNKNWVNDDFNPDGIRVCFLDGEGEWVSAKWNNNQDSWHTHSKSICENPACDDFEPSHWQEKPSKPEYNWKLCDQKVNGSCPHHNLHCAYPDCERVKIEI